MTDTTKEDVEAALWPLIRMIADGYYPSQKEVTNIISAMRTLGAEREALHASLKHMAEGYDAQVSDLAALVAERDAALAGAVRVKPLAWAKDGIGTDAARSILGVYLISKTGWGRASDRNETRSEDPKSAAQADYEARIRAALEPDPERLAKVEADLALAVDALDSIAIYGSDTLSGPSRSGPSPEPDDRKWQRDGVVEMVARAISALEALKGDDHE